MMPPLVALVCPMMAPPGLHDGPSYITAPSFSQGLTNFRKASDAVQCNGLTINCKPVYCRTHYPRYILPLQRPALQWCGRVGKFTEVKWSLVRFKLFQKGWNALRTGFPVELSNLYLKISFAFPFSKLSVSNSIVCVFMMREWKSTTISDRVLLRCFCFASLNTYFSVFHVYWKHNTNVCLHCAASWRAGNPQLAVTGAFCLPLLLPNFMQKGERGILNIFKSTKATIS